MSSLHLSERHTIRHLNLEHLSRFFRFSFFSKTNETFCRILRNFRLAPLWPEWNDAEINAESWDVGATRRREPMAPKGRPEPKISSQSVNFFFVFIRFHFEIRSEFAFIRRSRRKNRTSVVF